MSLCVKLRQKKAATSTVCAFIILPVAASSRGINRKAIVIIIASSCAGTPKRLNGRSRASNPSVKTICEVVNVSIEEISNSLDLITVNGARTLNILDQYGIEAGKPANFIVLNAKGEFEAVCHRGSVACSVRDGDFLFERAPAGITTTNGLLK